MSQIVIKKRISLEFLGEEYKQAYLVFRSVPYSDYEDFINKHSAVEASNDPKGYLQLMNEMLQKYFINGEFPNDKGILETVTKDDLKGLDRDALMKCFSLMTGVELDPKAETPSSSTSGTGNEPQTPLSDTDTDRPSA